MFTSTPLCCMGIFHLEAFQLFGVALGEALGYRFRFLVRSPRSRVYRNIGYLAHGDATFFTGFEEVGDLG